MNRRLNCVRCSGVQLQALHYESIEIDQCPKCKGIWLDDGEIAHIVETDEKKFQHELVLAAVESAFAGIPTHEINTVEHCPRCQTQLVALNFAYNSGVIVDRCPKGHGIWFDAGELEKVQAHHQHWKQQIEKDRPAWKKKLAEVEAGVKVEYSALAKDADEVPSRFLLNRVVEKVMSLMGLG